MLKGGGTVEGDWLLDLVLKSLTNPCQRDEVCLEDSDSEVVPFDEFEFEFELASSVSGVRK